MAAPGARRWAVARPRAARRRRIVAAARAACLAVRAMGSVRGRDEYAVSRRAALPPAALPDPGRGSRAPCRAGRGRIQGPEMVAHGGRGCYGAADAEPGAAAP